MIALPATRRQAIARLLAGGAALSVAAPVRIWAASAKGVRIGDGTLDIEFDGAMRARLWRGGTALTDFDAAHALVLADGGAIEGFTLLGHRRKRVNAAHGAGVEHVLRGTATGQGVERVMRVTFLDRYPGLALVETSYRNTGTAPLPITGWRAAQHRLAAGEGGMWSFAGASYPDRRDWVLPVRPGFDQRNFMGMNASDYGGGTPVAVLWRRDGGLAVGHVETVPKLVALPVAATADGASIGMAGDVAQPLAPGATLALPASFIMVHPGDHFRPLDAYRRIMAERGLAAPVIPASSYGAIWCAWGYERNFTMDEVVGALPKARELGLEWAVMDDGWQTSEGDWKLDPVKFPNGDADMKGFVQRIKAAGMRPRLWLAPLCADPGTDVLRDHADMLLLDANGERQKVTWWDAYTLCPAYQPVVDHFRGIVRRIIGDWGYEGLKLDGQHLNGVAPCYNPAHNHARPEESVEKLQDFWKAIYDEALAANPEAVVEICPCGDSFAFHNVPAMNNTPASDPLSSWQVRSKGKTFKALMGPSAPYSGDHVELSDGRNDFASAYGVGGILSTKFTWPRDTDHPTDTLPPGGWVLTAEKEVLWRQWIDLYNRNRLAQGAYLGGLYDIGFDRPEGHAVAKGDAIHYAFYGKDWDGPVELRGLGKGAYALSDGLTGAPLGTASALDNRLALKFTRFQLVRAVPVGGAA